MGKAAINIAKIAKEIENLLPQTQCQSCGYPSCGDYTKALLDGEAINRCPPGGKTTVVALAALLNRPPAEIQAPYKEYPGRQHARIVETECIGCNLCIPACPVDAIIGCQGMMHCVLTDHCTGCGLCLDPCPVDCIELLPAAEPATRPFTKTESDNFRKRYEKRLARQQRRKASTDGAFSPPLKKPSIRRELQDLRRKSLLPQTTKGES